MGVVKNLMVRIVTDASSLVGGMKKAGSATAQATSSVKESVAGMRKSVKSSFGSAQMSVREYAEHVAKTKENHTVAIQDVERLTDKIGQMKTAFDVVKSATEGLDVSKPLQQQHEELSKRLKAHNNQIRKMRMEYKDLVKAAAEIKPEKGNASAYENAQYAPARKRLAIEDEEKIADSIAKELERIDEAIQEIGDIDIRVVSDDGLKKLQAEIKKAEKELEIAQAQAEKTGQKLSSMGVGMSVGQMLKAEVAKVKEAAAGIPASFKAAGTDSAAGIQRLVISIKAIPASVLHRVTNGLNGISNAIRSIPDIPGRIWSGIKRIGDTAGQAVTGGVKRLGSSLMNMGGSALRGITSLPSKLLNIGKSASDSTGGLNKMVRSIRNIGVVSLGLRVASGLFGRLRSVISDYVSQNESLNASVTSLKNQMGQALAPAINIVIAAMQKLMPIVTSVANAVNSVFTELFGKVGSTTAAIASSAEAASAAADSLDTYSFDQITKVSDNSKSSSGSTSGSSTQATEQSGLVQKLTGWLQELKNAFVAGNWEGLGQTFANGINTALSAIDEVDVGAKVGKFINNLFTTFHSALSTTNFSGIGQKIGGLVTSGVETTNWEIVGKTIGKVFTALPSTIVGFINGTNWGLVSKSLSTALREALGTVSAWIQEEDWLQLGSSIRNFVSNIDYDSIAESLFSLLGTAIGARVGTLNGFIDGAVDSIKQYFTEKIQACGGNVAEGFLTGILDGFANIGTWIIDHIFTPFIEGFKSVFGIHSPSTVMEEMGGYLISGLLNGITNAWSSITEFFTGALDSLKQLLSDGWEKIKEGASAAWDKVSETVSDTWSGIESDVKSAGETVKTVVSDTWGKIREGTASAWDNVSNTVSDTWTDIKSGVLSAGENVKTVVTDKWGKIREETTTAWNKVSETVSEKWSNIKSGVTSAGENVKIAVSDIWEKIQEGTTTAWSKVFETVSEKWSAIKTDVTNATENVEATVSNAMNSVQTTVTEKMSETKSAVSTEWDSIKSTTATVCKDITAVASADWTAVKENVTSNLESAKTAASNTWTSIEETTSNSGEKLKSAVAADWKETASSVTNNLQQARTQASSVWTSIKSDATTASENIASSTKSSFQRVKDGIINAFSGTYTGVKEWNNQLIGGMESTVNSIIQGVNKMIKGFGQVASIGSAAGLDLRVSEISTVALPRLATGGIADGPTAAIIGEAGKEVVLPLENNTGWMDQMVQKIIEMSGGGGTPVTLQIVIGGRKVTEYLIKDINQITKTTGVCPIKV